MEPTLRPDQRDELIALAEARVRVAVTQVLLLDAALRKAEDRVWRARLRLEQLKARRAIETSSDDAPVRERRASQALTLAAVQRSLKENSAVTQRNIIYIVGAIILILVIAYFLGFLGT